MPCQCLVRSLETRMIWVTSASFQDIYFHHMASHYIFQGVVKCATGKCCGFMKCEIRQRDIWRKLGVCMRQSHLQSHSWVFPQKCSQQRDWGLAHTTVFLSLCILLHKGFLSWRLANLSWGCAFLTEKKSTLKYLARHNPALHAHPHREATA